MQVTISAEVLLQGIANRASGRLEMNLVDAIERCHERRHELADPGLHGLVDALTTTGRRGRPNV